MSRPKLSVCFLSALLATIALGLFACGENGSPTSPDSSPLPSTPEVGKTQGSSTPVATHYLAVTSPRNAACPPASKPHKERICHRSGSKFKLIEVGKPAVPAHMAHGDVMPGTEGLDCNCQPVTEQPGPDMIDIEKSTNGEDADEPPGPTLAEGAPVNWTYVVTNTGVQMLTNIVVTDDQEGFVSCPESSLDSGESMTCTVTGVVQAGPYANMGTVTATPSGGDEVSDSDFSHYFGGNVGVDIEKATNGEDADAAPGPTLNVGDPVTWTYVITNTSGDPLSDIVVTDDQEGFVICPESSLDPGESMTCTVTGVVQAGQYENMGTVSGTPPGAGPVMDVDPSHYFGGVVVAQGCTPGYWKQPHHFDSWPNPFMPESLFSDVFEDAFPGKTLREVLRGGGGGLNALGRHTVAALLNAAAGEVSFGLTPSEVIALFNDVFPGTKDEYNELKDSFEALNERGCPLN